jgi:hypothetical protein
MSCNDSIPKGSVEENTRITSRISKENRDNPIISILACNLNGPITIIIWVDSPFKKNPHNLHIFGSNSIQDGRRRWGDSRMGQKESDNLQVTRMTSLQQSPVSIYGRIHLSVHQEVSDNLQITDFSSPDEGRCAEYSRIYSWILVEGEEYFKIA